MQMKGSDDEEEEEKESLSLIHKVINFETCGFNSKDYFEMEKQLLDELKLHKSDLLGLDIEAQVESVNNLLKKHILRAFFGLCDGKTQDRIRLIERGETEKYIEQV
mmetsp:Transcript_31452/g.23351  ORF Transcript_31452/g.23351 Transcript_31452/m.23351 type:complete len:106 (+) Transcript_31452:225-542(+)